MFFGKTKTSGEATMYPKLIDDLMGWRVRAFGAGNSSIIVGAEKSVISWGPSPTRGELGYGKGEKTSSTKPKKMDPMENYIVSQIACERQTTPQQPPQPLAPPAHYKAPYCKGRHAVPSYHPLPEPSRHTPCSALNAFSMHVNDPIRSDDVAGGHSHTLMVIVGEDEDGLKKLAKFKPKPPKDIGERPVVEKKVVGKKKAAAKKAKDDDGEDGGDDDDDEPAAKKAKA
jgi:hypothetical protein